MEKNIFLIPTKVVMLQILINNMIFLLAPITILIGVLITAAVIVVVCGLIWVYRLMKSMKDLDNEN